MPIAVVLVGPQGSGKSTVVNYVKKKGFHSIIMGEALDWMREMDSRFGEEYPKETQNNGFLLPDEAIEQVFHAKIKSFPEDSNIVFDGCVRSIGQVDMIVDFLAREDYKTLFLYLDCSEEICQDRIDYRINYDLNHGHVVRKDDLNVESRKRRLHEFFSRIESILFEVGKKGFQIGLIHAEQPLEEVLMTTEKYLTTIL